MLELPPAAERWSLFATGLFLSTVPFGQILLFADPLSPSVAVLEAGVPLLLLAGVVYVGYRYGQMESPEFVAVVTAWTLSTVAGMVVVGLWLLTVMQLGGGVIDPIAISEISLSVGALVGMWLGTSNARWRQRDIDLARQRERLDYLNEILRHNVLNAMQIIMGRAEFLAAKTDDADAEAIVEWSETVSRQIQRMRLLSRVGTALTPVNLRDAVESGADVARDRQNIDLTLDVPSDASVVADDALEALVESLVMNAVERAPDGVAIDVAAEVSDDDVVLTVHDDAGGLTDEQCAILTSRKTDPGVFGFGLYLVATLVDRYGGSVSIPTATDDETTISVTLPHAPSARR